MSQVTRADGQIFIVPSYRDSISAQKESILKRELTILSGSYGEYVNLRKAGKYRYEVAFSHEIGPLLGETVLDYFNNPNDLIYCEEIPETGEAVLVIVKSGSVYVDGIFTLDSIADELVAFLTQESEFEIYTSGSVPISKEPEDGKFSFSSDAVKKFEILKEPVFDKLPVLRKFELQPLDILLKEKKIGVFPTEKLVLGLIVVALFFGCWWLVNIVLKTEVSQQIITQTVDPYSEYKKMLKTPDPALEMKNLLEKIILLYSMPGWEPIIVNYQNNKIFTNLRSQGARTNSLYSWAKANNIAVEIQSSGFKLNIPVKNLNRASTKVIYRFDDVIGTLIDRLSFVLPGNSLSISNISRNKYITAGELKITFVNLTPATFGLLSDQLKQLPLVITMVTVSLKDDNISGSIDLKALGN